MGFQIIQIRGKTSQIVLLQCAESALKSVIGDLSHTYFVGNAPMGHTEMQPMESGQDLQTLKVVFLAPNSSRHNHVMFVVSF